MINWTSFESGIWNDPNNWDAPAAPGPNDDAKHLKMLNHIEVAGDRSCLSFEGTSGKGDRFLRIDSGNKLAVGIGGLFKSIGAGTPIANFPVRMRNGAFNNRTTANVAGVINGIDFGPARKHQANDVQLLFSGAMRDSSILFGDSASIFAFGSGDIASTSLTVGDDATLLLDNRNITGPGNHTVAWNIGDRGTMSNVVVGSGVTGRISGVDVTVGTSGAKCPDDTTSVYLWWPGGDTPITDNWLLRGCADVSVDVNFTAATGGGASIALQDNANMSVDGAAWGGDWAVSDAASVTVGGTFFPDTLLLDGATVNGFRIGPKGGAVWDLTIQNGGTIITQDQPGVLQGWLAMSGTFFGFPYNSVLTYNGLGNNVHTSEVDIGGELVRGGWAADLEIGVDGFFLVTTELVHIENGQTVTTPFDSENVSLVIEGTGVLKTVESTGPDYKGYNDHGVLFADSACVHRWAKLVVPPSASVNTVDDVCNTPISGNANGLVCPAGPPPGGVPEAMYVTDLEVQPGATLVAGIGGQLPADVNIYYTGTLSNNGSIVDRFGQAYTPMRLKPTLYGDFNGDGEGDEADAPGSDTRRFNDAFCTCIGVDANYDPLVDWNCDGAIDDLDRDEYNANWNNPPGLTTAPCGTALCSS